MESSQMEQTLQMVLTKMAKAEEKKVEHTKKYKEWIKGLISDETHLVETLVKCSLNEKIDEKSKVGIYKIFRKLLMIDESKEKIQSELSKNKEFQKCLVDYITSKKKEEIEEDPYALLFQVFKIEDFKEFYSEKFISAIFYGLEVLKSEEELIYGLLIFLIDLASSDNKEEAQLFLTCHKNADVKEFMFFNESILSLITKTSKEANIPLFKKVIKCITYIMDNEDKEILYRNDIETLFLSIQEELQLYNDIQFKIGYMQFLYRIVKLDLFKKMDLDIDSLKEFLEDENMAGELKGHAIKVLDVLSQK